MIITAEQAKCDECGVELTAEEFFRGDGMHFICDYCDTALSGDNDND